VQAVRPARQIPQRISVHEHFYQQLALSSDGIFPVRKYLDPAILADPQHNLPQHVPPFNAPVRLGRFF
jgi:hypothetical protein